nr:glycoside hydrolase family 3 protein [Natrinema sp. SYSU A 869]
MTGRERPSESDDCPIPDPESLTLTEKVGQLVGAYVGSMGDTELSVDDTAALVRDEGVGTIAAFGIGISPHRDPRRVAEIANRLQRVAIEETHHGIPLLLPVDAVHGHAYVDGATVFPHGLGVAATRNPANARLAGEITAAEMRATGANLNYGPTCDVARDPRWGRTFETFGESPLLCGAFAGATVRGLESEADGPRVAATAKHFPAYGDPAGGEDAAAVDRSASTIHRLFVPPFARAIDAGASVVMPCYNSIDGEPAHGSRRYLIELLRERLGFNGAVASDWGGIDHLHEDHRVTASQRDSARTAVDAGLDLISIGRDEYTAHIRDLVEAGDLSEARIDDAVSRILELKASLGLFEDPYVDVERVRTTVGASAHRRAALQAARESQTLLENGGVLPLADDLDSILVAGPNADSLCNQYGGWSVQDPDPDSGTTVLEGIAGRAGDETTVQYEQGATLSERGTLRRSRMQRRTRTWRSSPSARAGTTTSSARRVSSARPGTSPRGRDSNSRPPSATCLRRSTRPRRRSRSSRSRAGRWRSPGPPTTPMRCCTRTIQEARAVRPSLTCCSATSIRRVGCRLASRARRAISRRRSTTSRIQRRSVPTNTPIRTIHSMRSATAGATPSSRVRTCRSRNRRSGPPNRSPRRSPSRTSAIGRGIDRSISSCETT